MLKRDINEIKLKLQQFRKSDPTLIKDKTCTALQRSGGLKQQYELIPTQQDSPQSHQS
ncbi:hypothetical protein PPACK8108_LOCUS11478 [Phakopsora pachyrhizi]|uniref:Uncharacterized protein n=1 Tax=Phakopsora pachyrhizi TaxID=170000 RepID=A0AAV0B0N8_PHAPC|nr:hypothetical protein PPACK8108_LOCUS11478 [Phakopsora pachyrhizi]